MTLRQKNIALFLACIFAGMATTTVECTPFLNKKQSPSWKLPLGVTRGGYKSSVSPDEASVAIADPEVALPAVDANDTASTDTDTASTDNKENDDNNDDGNTTLVFEASKVGDGSESDPDGLPRRFLRMQKGNREKAKAAFEHTVQWRKENNVNTILKRPQPKFDLCKKIFPVYIPGRDQQNHVVVVQRVGLIDVEYGEQNDVSGDDLLWYYIYIVEYCWNILEPSPDAVMTTIMDLKGVGLSTFRDKNIRKFLRMFVGAMSENYPSRSHKTLLINSPGWINMAYNLVKPLLRSSTREKISICNGGKKQDELLVDILGADHVPRELLHDPSAVPASSEGDVDDSNSKTGHVLSDIEKEIRKLCISSLENNGVEMLPVP